MLQKSLAAVLCLVLCPLLAAQRTLAPVATSDVPQTSVPALALNAPHALPEFVTIPKDTQIELMLLDPLSSATYKRGDPFRYAVAKDLIVDGIVAMPSGAPLAGVVTKATKAVPHKRYGDIDFRPTDIEVVEHHKLRLTDSPSGPSMTRKERRQMALISLAVPIMAPVGLVLLGVNAGLGLVIEAIDKDPQKGKNDVKFPVCQGQTWYVKSKTRIRIADLPVAPAGAAAIFDSCKGTPATTEAAAVAP
jgi:hypothetical protein